MSKEQRAKSKEQRALFFLLSFVALFFSCNPLKFEREQQKLTSSATPTILPLTRVLAIKKLLRKHQGQIEKLSLDEKAELTQVRQILSHWRSLPISQKQQPPPTLPPPQPLSTSQNLHMAIEIDAIAKIRMAFSKAEVRISPITKTPIVIKKIQHSASTPINAIESFLAIYPAWGRFAKEALRDCKEIQIKNKNYEGLAVTCQKKAYTLPVEYEFLRFFLKKETPQQYHLTKVISFWHRSHENKQIIRFKHQEETLWRLLENKRQDLSKAKSVLTKALRFDAKHQRYEPIWKGLVASKESIRKWHILVDDTTDQTDFYPAEQESGNYQGQVSAHVVTPTSTRFSNIQGEFGFKSQVCRLGDIITEETYTGCSCENQVWSAEQTNNEDPPTLHGKADIPLNASCQATCQGGFVLKARANSRHIYSSFFEPAVNPPLQGGIVVGLPTNQSCGLNPSNLNATCSDCGNCMCYQSSNGIDCHLDPLALHAYYHLNYFIRTLNANGPFFLTEAQPITFNLYHPPHILPPHHIMGTIHMGSQHLATSTRGPGNLYHLIYHEAAHAYSHYTGTIGFTLLSLGPPFSEELPAYNEGLANYVASSLSDFTAGYAPNFMLMAQQQGDPEASVSPINQYRLYPDTFKTVEQCPRDGCTIHHSGMIWENAYIELEKRVGKASALQLVLSHGLHTSLGNPLYEPNFVRRFDLYHDDCLNWTSSTQGYSIQNSFYAAMQEANDPLFDKKYTLEVWDAFDRLLGRPRECLRQPDEFSNYKEAATFIHPAYSVQVERSPHFREGLHPVPTQINYEGDEDWFYFYAAQEKNFLLSVDPTTPALMTEISVHQADGSAILIGEVGQSPSHQSMSGIGITAQVTTPQRGYYYIRLRANSRSEAKTGVYKLTLSPYAFPDAESNQMNESATMLSLQGSDSAVEGTIHSSFNQDYYRFLTTGWHQPYRIHLQALQQQNLKLSVYVDGNLHSETETNNSIVDASFSFAPGRWIFVKISSALNNPHIGTYRLFAEPLQTGSELEEFSQTFEDPSIGQTITENIDPRSIATPIVLEMNNLNNRIANTIVDDLPRYYRFWAERGEDIIIETFGLKQTATTRLFLYEQIHKFPPQHFTSGAAESLLSQGLPALRKRRIWDPMSNLMKTSPPQTPDDPPTVNAGYARLRTGNGSISRSFGDSLEIGAAKIHFHVPLTGWYVVGVQPENLGERGDYTIQFLRHAQHSAHLSFPNKHQCEPPTP